MKKRQPGRTAKKHRDTAAHLPQKEPPVAPPPEHGLPLPDPLAKLMQCYREDAVQFPGISDIDMGPSGFAKLWERGWRPVSTAERAKYTDGNPYKLMDALERLYAYQLWSGTEPDAPVVLPKWLVLACRKLIETVAPNMKNPLRRGRHSRWKTERGDRARDFRRYMLVDRFKSKRSSDPVAMAVRHAEHTNLGGSRGVFNASIARCEKRLKEKPEDFSSIQWDVLEVMIAKASRR